MDPAFLESLGAMGAATKKLAPFINQAEIGVLAAVALFVRISAIVFLLPGFGERTISVRVKLTIALAFAVVSWPLVAKNAEATFFRGDITGIGILYAYVAEAISGLLLGILVRLMVFALQTAGAIAAQSLSISQMFGAGIAPDPEPTIATILSLGGITLALSLGLHVKIAELIALSYDPLPMGSFPLAADATEHIVIRVAEAFLLAVSISLPFVVIAFVYNISLGFINKAMPQIMVSFVGLPAITWVGILMLMLVSTAALTVWNRKLDAVLAAPLGP
jgi:flagellar biosynthetic protein FliR